MSAETTKSTPSRVGGAHQDPTPATGRDQRTIFFFFTALILMVSFGSPTGGLINVPVIFFLKNQLHLNAEQTSTFRLIAGIPLYLTFVFGFIRDSWNPFGLKDRGYFLIFGFLTAALFLAIAFLPPTYELLLGAIIVLTCSYRFISSAWNGLLALIGQKKLMSGQMSTIWNLIPGITGAIALFMGGKLSDFLHGHNPLMASRILFSVGAAIMIAVALFGLWKPRAVYETEDEEPKLKAHFFKDVKRLVRHWPIYPAALINLLWNFAPGSDTPLAYYMTSTLKLQDSDFANFNAVFSLSFIPMFIAYAFLCKKFTLRTLLIWGTVIAIPQMVPLLFINSGNMAIAMAVPIGLMGGLATAAFIDLAIRSCPPGLQGTMMMLIDSVLLISARFGDKLGTYIFDRSNHNFIYCVIAITVVYACILPIVLLIPKKLISTRDGEAPEGGKTYDEVGEAVPAPA